MRAWRCVRWGGSGDLELGELPTPAPAPGRVVIAAEAWGVNFADLVLIAGRYQARPAFPFAPGMEVAGRISAVVADGCGGFNVGDRVAAYVEYGGYADQVAAPVANIARLPDSVAMTVGAVFPTAYGAAQLAIERASLAAGEIALISGAGGAVGQACVELASACGAKVIACAGDDEKAAIARTAGAGAVLSSRSANMREDIRAAAPEGVDVAIDPVGGGFFPVALRSLAYGGRLVSVGFASGEIPSVPANHVLVKHVSVIGSSLGLTCHRDPGRVADIWPPLTAMLEAGTIRPRISATLPFEALADGLTLLEERRIGGRVILVD